METPRLTTDTSSGTRRGTAFLVNELYASIQGESTYAGRPCSFVRLAGCPLRCAWCDSEFSFAGGERMSLDDIIDGMQKLGLPLVEVTGGEPLANPNCPQLLARLCDEGFTVLLETSGALDISAVDPRVIKIIDIKCPGSGMSDKNMWENLGRLAPADEIKFVIADRADYEWARAIIARYDALRDGRPVLFSPVHGQMDPGTLGEWIFGDRLNARLQVQLHKYLWPGKTRLV
ncbi:radical SAM protein [bacterium]|nr:radical SAM protein [bacterium]